MVEFSDNHIVPGFPHTGDTQNKTAYTITNSSDPNHSALAAGQNNSDYPGQGQNSTALESSTVTEYAYYWDADLLEQYKVIWECMVQDAENTAMKYNQSALHDGNMTSFCNTTHDTVSCWPTTQAGLHATIKCPDEYDGIKINPLGKASKFCFENGTWDEWANYSQCVPHDHVDQTDILHNKVVRTIYYVGFSVSTAALIAALFIFLYFKVLRCIRNTIHCHLIVTFILKNLMWILLNIVVPHLAHVHESKGHEWGCKIIVAIYIYLQVTNFFWMLVEGLYLFSIIVWAFATDKFRIWYFILIGWGTPLLIILTWCIVKATKDNEVGCWLSAGTSNYDYIYIVPNLIALGINTIILGVIVFVLIKKLRATQSDRVTRKIKAARATLILVPLLGVTYVLFITPFWDHEVAHHIFTYINATLQSHQGLAVAILYCFMNTEVKNTIKQRFSRWQDERSVATRYTRASVVSATHDAFYDFKRRRRSSSLFNSNKKRSSQSSDRRFSCDTNDNAISLDHLRRETPEGSCAETTHFSNDSRRSSLVSKMAPIFQNGGSGMNNNNVSSSVNEIHNGHIHGSGGTASEYVVSRPHSIVYEDPAAESSGVNDTLVHFEQQNGGGVHNGNGAVHDSNGYSKLVLNTSNV